MIAIFIHVYSTIEDSRIVNALSLISVLALARPTRHQSQHLTQLDQPSSTWIR